MGSPEKPYPAILLPGAYGKIDYSLIMEDLIDAVAAFEVYKEKMRDSRAKMSWIVSLQQNEALKSSMLEGTQATLDGVLVNQIIPDDSNANLNEVSNYFDAAVQGQTLLKRGDFDDDFFCSIHKTLLSGKIRKNLGEIGKYRAKQNYIGTNDKDTNEPVCTPEEAKSRVEDILVQHFGGYTIQEADGGWEDGGIRYREYSVVVYLSDTDLNSVHAAADDLIKEFNQSSVLIQANETRTEFYGGSN